MILKCNHKKARTDGMELFSTTMGRMAFLFSLLLIGYLLVKLKVLDVASAGVLSKLENKVFLPALMLGMFLSGFTTERLAKSGWMFLAGVAVLVVTVPLAILGARLCTRDGYLRSIYTYGLSFSNFGFMGNAVVSVLFPEIFAEYLVFTLPFWILIQLWGIPTLLISSDGKQPSIGKSLKALCNPMLIGMLIGMIIGISGLTLPTWLSSLVTETGACMSPVAMILTGMTVAGIDLGATVKNASIWKVSLLRPVAFPVVGLIILVLLPIPEAYRICILCVLAMPLGRNTVVVPSAYGRDTTAAAGMALISHVLSCITIPLIFLAFQTFI